MNGVTLASGYARRLVETEARRSGTPVKDAIAPVARRLRASEGSVYNLLFRRPKQVAYGLVRSLEDAVKAEIRREIGALENELAGLESSALSVGPRAVAEAQESLARLKAALRGDA